MSHKPKHSEGAAPPPPHASLAYAIAQLRHAYHQLIGPDAAWNRERRMRFADGLIGPQIVRIEKYLASSPSLRSVHIEHPDEDGDVFVRLQGYSQYDGLMTHSDTLRGALVSLVEVLDAWDEALRGESDS